MAIRTRTWVLGCLAIAGISGVLFVAVAIFSIRALLLESGAYSVSHGFRVNGPAYRAIQEVQAKRPGVHLVVETQRAFVGPELHANIHFAEEFNPRDYVQIETRGLTIEVERFLYEKRILKFIITHDGRANKEDGYSLVFHERP